VDPVLVLALIVLGGFAGFAAGLLGVGGGMLTVPFITMLLSARDFPHQLVVHVAIATSLGIILFTSISSVRAHHRHGAVMWPVVKQLAPGILIGSWIGPWIGAQIPSTALALFFALFISFSATQMLADRKPKPSRELPGTTGMLGMGLFTGTLSGLVGAGGGFISVPFMAWCNVRIHNAVATSAALGFPIALAGTLSNVYFGLQQPGMPAGTLGFVYLPALVLVASAAVLTAPVGARTAHALPVKSLKRVFALMLYGLAGYMLVKGMS
jgi:uncharacterized membrane protein YfcA